MTRCVWWSVGASAWYLVALVLALHAERAQWRPRALVWLEASVVTAAVMVLGGLLCLGVDHHAWDRVVAYAAQWWP